MSTNRFNLAISALKSAILPIVEKSYQKTMQAIPAHFVCGPEEEDTTS